MDRENLYSSLSIDPNALGFECMDQPKRFMEWAEKMADAIKGRNDIKKQISSTRASKDRYIRMNPREYGLEKITEGAVASLLDDDEDLNKLDEEMVEAQYLVDLLSAAKEAFSQRKSMLESLVSLYISGYFSEPKVVSSAVTKMAEDDTAKLHKIMNEKETGRLPALKRKK